MRTTQLTVVIAVAIALAACGRQDEQARNPPREQVTVERSGFSTRGEAIGVAALIRNGTRDAFRAIDLRVSFLDGGRRIATTRATLRGCRSTSCWWGESFIGPSITSKWPGIDTVEVSIVRSTGRVAKMGTARELRAVEVDGEVAVRGPGQPGSVHVIAFVLGRPRFAASGYFTTGTEQLRPGIRWRTGERYRAYFYPGPAPALPAS